MEELPKPQVTEAEADPVVSASGELWLLADRAAKADSLELRAYQRAAVPLELSAVAANVTAAVASFAFSTGNLGKELAGVTLVGGAAIAEHIRGVYAANRPGTMTVNGGYGLQCLRVANQPNGFSDKPVAVAIHPNDAPTAEATRAQVRESLSQALGVVAGTAETSDIIGEVIVPASIVRRAGLLHTPRQTYAELMDTMLAQKVGPLYPADEGAVVIPAKAAGALAEQLRDTNPEELSATLQELAAIFPGKLTSLQADNPDLLKVLHGLVVRATAADGGIRMGEHTKNSVAITDYNEDGTKKGTRYAEILDGGFRVTSFDLMSRLDVTNPYNPRVIKVAGATGQETSSDELRTLAERARTQGDYDGLALLSKALEQLEAKHTAQLEAAENPPEPETVAEKQPTEHPAGPVRFLEAAKTQPNRRALQRRYLGRSAVAGALFVGISAAVAGSYTYLNDWVAERDQTVETPTATQHDRIYRVDDHGLAAEQRASLDSLPAYWRQNVSYTYDLESGWQVSQERAEIKIILPRELGDDIPHLTVTALSKDREEALLIQDGTAVGALRAYDSAGNAYPTTLYRSNDGTARVQVEAPADVPYTMEYDLVDDPLGSWAVEPQQHIATKQPLDITDATQYPGAAESLEEIAEDVAGTFIYDNTDKLKQKLREADSLDTLVESTYEQHRCQCDQCATATVLVNAAMRPDEKVGVVLGFRGNPAEPESHTYIDSSWAHTWLDNGGHIVDPTAEQTDAQSEVVEHPPVGILEQQWERRIATSGGLATANGKGGRLKSEKQTVKTAETHKPGPDPWDVGGPLLGMLAVGLAGVEARHRVLRRAVAGVVSFDRWQTAAMDLDPRDAVDILGWEAFGSIGTTMPEPTKGAGSTKNPDNIPTETLQRVARGEVRTGNRLTTAQTRGLRLTAKALLRERGIRP